MTIAMRIMISSEEIQAKVKQLGEKINAHYAQSDKELVLIGLLRGSVIFMADLCRAIEKPHELDFMTVSSYVNGTTISSRDVKILKDLEEDIQGRNIIIVEDIIDTGNTLKKVQQILNTRDPKRVKICTLLDKPERREVEIEVDYIGFKIPDEFVVGYGIDFAQKHRTLPYIGIIKKEEE